MLSCSNIKAMNNKNKDQSGFTLIELMVVIAIVGILSSIAVISMSNSRSKARDSRRMADITAMQEAVELYMESHATPPDPAQETWAGLESDLGPFVQGGTLPLDPQASDGFRYAYCHFGYNYVIAGVMENNQEIPNDIDGAHNYIIASECIFSGNHTDVLSCTDTAGGGNISGKSGSVFCVGYSKGA